MKALSSLTAGFLVAVLSACGGSGGGGGGATGGELRTTLDITKVTGFAVAGAVARAVARDLPFHWESHLPALDRATTTNQLWTMNDDNTMTVVTVTSSTDEAGSTGNTTATIYPQAVFNTKAFVILAYTGVVKNGASCPLIAARKTDGALFCVTFGGAFRDGLNDPSGTSSGNPITKYFPPIQTDSTGNIIWLNGPNLIKLDFTDPANPTETTPVDNSVTNGRLMDGLAVNAAGDAFFAYNFGRTKSSRVQHVGGGFTAVTTNNANCLTPFASGSDDFYFLDDTNILKRVTKGGTSFSVGASLGTVSADCAAGLVQTPTRVFLAKSTTSNQIIEISNQVATTRTISDLDKITKMVGTDTELVILGTTAAGASRIVRYTISNSNTLALLTPGAYVVNTMAVAANGDITFHAERAADGAMVVGNIVGSATETIIKTGVPAPRILQRIN